MARVDKGDTLLSNTLQPGWKVSDDGFGLHTIIATFKADTSLGFTFVRGEPFPVTEFGYCYLHKQTTSYDNLGIATTVAEYVGIDQFVNGGDNTKPQMTQNGGLTTEKIETRPNFTVNFEGEPRNNIAGAPPYTQSPIGPLVSIKNPADFTSAAVTGGAVAITKQQSFIGENGACFENEDGGKFLGFVDPAFPYFYGKTSYLAEQQTFSGIVYVATASMANDFVSMLSLSSGDETWNGNLPAIMPDYLPGPWTQTVGSGEDTDTYNQLLLTQVNIESFGDLYKVTYEIKFSIPGWHPAVYGEAQAPE
jgi:hypothetical protein